MNKNIDSEIDDLLNDFDFKPITQGLGFHHSLKDKKEVSVSLKTKAASLGDDLETRATSLKKNYTHDEKKQNINMGDLSPFYNNEPKQLHQEIELSIPLTQDEEQVIENESATYLSRTIAWGIDMIMLTAIMLITVTGILISTDVPLEIINVFMISDDLLMSFTALSAMFYIFYFSFLDKTNYSTPGKRMMSIKVDSNFGRLSLFQTFSRTIISILCVFTLGLISLTKLQDTMTNTKVVVSK